MRVACFYKKIKHRISLGIFFGNRKLILDMIKYIIFNPGTLNIIVTAINCLMEKRKVVIKYKVCKVEIKNFFTKVSNL